MSLWTFTRCKGSGFRVYICIVYRRPSNSDLASATEGFRGTQKPQRAVFTAQVYRGVLNKTRDVAVKTFAHQGSDPEVIRFNAVSV